MAVSIRLSRGGAKKRPYYRIVVADSRSARDGKYLEQIGTYNPLLAKDDAKRVNLNEDRARYWLGVGAQPSDRVRVLIKKYGASGTHLEQQKAARERLAMPKVVPDPGEPAYIPPAETPAQAPGNGAEASSQSEGVKGSKGPMQLLPGLVLHGPNAQFTPEAESILRDGLAWRLR